MATPRIEIAPERIADGQRLYESTLTPVPDIAAMMGVSPRTLTRRIAEWGWVARSAPRHKTDRALVAVSGAAGGAAAPVSLAARIHNTVARGLDAVDRVLDKVGPADEAGAERSARTLAAVARTLREIAPLTQPDEVMPPDDADDDPVPRDIDEFRRELARRIRGFIEARRIGAGGFPGEPESALD